MARTPRIGQGKGAEHWHALVTRGLGDPFWMTPGIDQTLHNLIVDDETSAACALATLGAALVGQGYRSAGANLDGNVRMIRGDRRYVEGVRSLDARVCTFNHKER